MVRRGLSFSRLLSWFRVWVKRLPDKSLNGFGDVKYAPRRLVSKCRLSWKAFCQQRLWRLDTTVTRRLGGEAIENLIGTNEFAVYLQWTIAGPASFVPA